MQLELKTKRMTKPNIQLKIFIVFQLWFTLSSLPCEAQSKKSVDSLLHCIDEAIDNSAIYVGKKEQQISKLKKDLSEAKTDYEQYLTSFKLYEEYTPFINDSAIYYLNHCISIARKMGGAKFLRSKMSSPDCPQMLQHGYVHRVIVHAQQHRHLTTRQRKFGNLLSSLHSCV